MKTKISSATKEEAQRLIKIAKEKGLIKSHTIAFKEFPVEEEIHKGKTGEYKSI